ncbi:MAG: ABC transporter ATP-binding protein [Bacteroidaceae bacterium]|jgi:ABC-type multidrug transport system ATPase subunit|nr:ABC transporter ATP-binding protein [Bacteroidaceae bacterium]
MLKISKVSLSYGSKQVLHDVSFHLQRGELGCVLGESGCGKTTLLRAVMGFEECSGGSIEVDGIVLSAMTVDSLRQRIAYLPQELSLPSPTIWDMVSIPFSFKANKGVELTEELLQREWSRLGLDIHLINRPSNSVSVGQRQRIMLSVCCLLGKPLIIIDEPTSALDNDTTLLVANYLKSVARERDAAILAVTHSHTLAEVCDKTLHL